MSLFVYLLVSSYYQRDEHACLTFLYIDILISSTHISPAPGGDEDEASLESLDEGEHSEDEGEDYKR